MKRKPEIPVKSFFAGRLCILIIFMLTSVSCAGLDSTEPLETKYTETGKASWYGGKFQGRLTASGERFDTRHMTAAHKSLPFGTIVRVENLETGKSAIVRINDRGPFVEGRIIDLSMAAAKKIEMLGSGIADVRITVQKWPEKKWVYKADVENIHPEKSISDPPAESSGSSDTAEENKADSQGDSTGSKSVTLQVAAYTELRNFENTVTLLRKAGFTVKGERDSGVLRVLVAEVRLSHVEKVKKQLKDLGYPGSFVRSGI